MQWSVPTSEWHRLHRGGRNYFSSKAIVTFNSNMAGARLPWPRNGVQSPGRINREESLILSIAVLVFAAIGSPQAASPAKPPTTAGAAFDKLKSLVGEWEGILNEEGQQIPATTSFRLVSDGSALMSVLGAGTPHEMVTMFHLDNSDLLATHYCAAHNQPRFRLAPSPEQNVVTFDFKDATNLSSPTAPHMVGLKITFLDANHHYEDWTFLENGRKSTSRFDFRRKA